MYASPEVAAVEVLKRHWDGSLPVPVEAIAQSMGAALVPVTSTGYSGYFLAASDPNNPYGANDVIQYNVSDSPNRQRFTIAHELGHMVLGHVSSPRDYPDNYSASSNVWIERSANRFAAEILMPAHAVDFLISKGYTGIDELARLFAVSTMAMGFRLSNLRAYA